MTTSPNRPSLQLFNQLFDVQRSKEYSALKEYLEDDGAFFSLAEKGARGLMRDYGLSAQDAQRFIRAANALAIVVRRQFIERTSCLDEATPYQPSSGLLSIVAGPSYEVLFRPNFDLMCPPNALESWTSPAAYLIDLLRWIRDRIETEADADAILLHERRHDLKSLMIDANAVYQPASAVDIIVSVLETFIKEHKPSVVDVDEAMSTAHYPNTLPYYRDWTTINHVARLNGMSVGKVARTVDLSFPYFLQHNAKSEESGGALLHGSRLGPYQREMLTMPLLDSTDPDELEEFYHLNFGSDGIYKWQNLNQIKHFCERTDRLALDIEQLLSIRSFVPLRSPNAPDAPLESSVTEAARSGSVYINGGQAPSLGIDHGVNNFLHRFTEPPESSPARYDRMNRKIRLDQWLNLPTELVDALLVAAIKAEDPDAPYLITDKTLQALGLFQDLRERYGCLAEDFAVFIGELSVYGRGETLSSFDRAFNAQALFSTPLQLDGGEFPVFPEPGAETLTVKQICSGLGIDLYTYRHLAQAIARAHTLGTLVRTAPVLSSFYRLVKIARLLGITPVEGLLMLATLGGVSWVNALAGVPRLYANPDVILPDTLNVIHALESCVGWCRERELPVLWMLQQVTPVVAPVASANEQQLFAQVRSLYPSTLLSNAALLMAGVPPLAGGADWLDLLTLLVSRSGLVLPDNELDYPAFARTALDEAVRAGLGDMEPSVQLAIVDTMLAVLLQARAGQVSVVKECVAVYAGLNSELVPAVLDWADMTVYQLLFYVQELADVEEAGADVSWRLEPVIDPFLGRLAEVRRRSAVVVRLELSVELLEDYLSYGYDAWLEPGDEHELSVRTLYYLTVLVRAFGLSQQPPGNLLEYLRAVDALPDPLTGDALSLAREAAAIRLAAFFGWSVQDVRECASRVGNSTGVIRTLTELDLLIRVRVLASASNMDAETIFLMGLLPQALDREAYATAAEHALQSLNETPEELIPDLEEALGQLAKMTWTVDRTTLIANKPGEKAVVTVTVTDANLRPLSGVTVYWQSNLGVIRKSDTDPNGVATTEFIPGNIMGKATLYCWLDLMKKREAAIITIGPDPATLQFPRGSMSQVPDGGAVRSDHRVVRGDEGHFWQPRY
jgi:hypothetical protein